MYVTSNTLEFLNMPRRKWTNFDMNVLGFLFVEWPISLNCLCHPFILLHQILFDWWFAGKTSCFDILHRDIVFCNLGVKFPSNSDVACWHYFVTYQETCAWVWSPNFNFVYYWGGFLFAIYVSICGIALCRRVVFSFNHYSLCPGYMTPAGLLRTKMLL